MGEPTGCYAKSDRENTYYRISLYVEFKIKAALFPGTSEVAGCFRMKLNISFPVTGCQKLIEVDDERKLHTFYEKHMATEIDAGTLGEQ